MADVFSKEKRSWVMSRIRSRSNRNTELAMLALLRAHHISRWRRHFSIEGRPDFAFPTSHIALFIDGCFWHACPPCALAPASNKKFWQKKLEANRRRDRLVVCQLGEEG